MLGRIAKELGIGAGEELLRVIGRCQNRAVATFTFGGHVYTVVTDHTALKWILLETETTERLAR